MEDKRTDPVKLDVPEDRRDDLHTTIEQFNDAANYTVQNARKDDGYLILDKSKIHDRVYYDLRERTDLPANLCVRPTRKPSKLSNRQSSSGRRATVARSLDSRSCPPSTTNGR